MQVIHQRWAAAASLDALLPASRVFTGRNPDPTVPYGVVSKLSAAPECQYNDGSAVVSVTLRFDVVDSQYDAAAAVVQQIKIAFNRSDFSLAGEDKVIDMEWIKDSERQTDDGVWECGCEFRCSVYLASGV